MKAVYCIGILDFTFDDYENEPEKSEVVHTIKLKNQYGKTFYEKLTYIYLELPNFKLTEDLLTTRLDKWIYFIKHLEDFQTIPIIFRDEVFSQAFEKAELAKYDEVELSRYQNSLKIYRDNKAVYETAIETAFDNGYKDGQKKIAMKLKIMGVAIEVISASTVLSNAEIEQL